MKGQFGPEPHPDRRTIQSPGSPVRSAPAGPVPTRSAAGGGTSDAPASVGGGVPARTVPSNDRKEAGKGVARQVKGQFGPEPLGPPDNPSRFEHVLDPLARLQRNKGRRSIGELPLPAQQRAEVEPVFRKPPMGKPHRLGSKMERT